MNGFKLYDRVATKYNAWTLRDGTRRPAYGRIVAKLADGPVHVEFDFGPQGKLTILIPEMYLEHDPRITTLAEEGPPLPRRPGDPLWPGMVRPIPTLAENVARLREKQRAIIEADRAEAAEIERKVMAWIEGAPDWLEREKAVAWGRAILGRVPIPAADGQANTSGIRRDFEPEPSAASRITAIVCRWLESKRPLSAILGVGPTGDLVHVRPGHAYLNPPFGDRLEFRPHDSEAEILATLERSRP